VGSSDPLSLRGCSGGIALKGGEKRSGIKGNQLGREKEMERKCPTFLNTFPCDTIEEGKINAKTKKVRKGQGTSKEPDFYLKAVFH